jgi:uncharacterized protein (TIGR03118 family)
MRSWIQSVLGARKQPVRRPWSRRLCLEALEERAVPAVGGNNFLQTNVVANVPGVAANTDTNLVAPIGIADGTGGAFWVSDSGTNVSTLYGVTSTSSSVVALIVAIPGPGTAPNVTASPTGQTAPSADGTTFPIPGSGAGEGPASAAAFVFATSDGTIAAWDGKLSPDTQAIRLVDDSATGADFTGLTSAVAGTTSLIYVTDFRNGAVDAFGFTETSTGATTANIVYQSVPLAANAFQDPMAIHEHLAPYNIQNLGGNLFVTYAKVGADGSPVLRAGKGMVAEFDTSGKLIQTFSGNMDAPYGVALAPSGFGRFGGDLLVANTGTGTISAFNVSTGAFDGTLNDTGGQPLTISGLRALHFGNGVGGGLTSVLYFTASPTTGPAKGIFGSLSFASETSGAQADTAILQTELALHASAPAFQASLLTLLNSAESQLNQDMTNGVMLSKAQSDLLVALDNVTAANNPNIDQVALNAPEKVIDAAFLELVAEAFV